MRIILAVIVTACAVAVLIDSPRRELEAEIDRQWQEYREHVGGISAFPANPENLQNSFNSRLDTKR